MTETEWLASTNAVDMLFGLKGRRAGDARRSRLFACATIRLVAHLLTDTRSVQAVEAAERYADGQANREMLKAHRRQAAAAAKALFSSFGSIHSTNDAHAAAARAAEMVALVGFPSECVATTAWAARAYELAGLGTFRAARTYHAHLLRCIYGNPFRPVSSGAPWAVGNHAARALAATMYTERQFIDLPILADALEEGGCTEDAVLAHCRGETIHARGCWVVDLVLGRR